MQLGEPWSGVWDTLPTPPGCVPRGGPAAELRAGLCAGGRGPALTAASGPHCGVCPGSSFSWEQSRRRSGPAASGCPALGCRPQAALTLLGPSGLSSRSMEETLSRLLRRLMPAKGLAMTPGDT